MNLEAIAPIIEQIIKESLEEKRYTYGTGGKTGVGNKVASSSLKDSVKVTATNDGVNGIIDIMMNDYGQWVQSGRLPGKGGVPIGSLLKWIKDRKLQGRDKKGRFITNNSFAFAIRNNIRKFGIRPANFLDISFDKIMEDPRIIELLGESTYEDLINAIEGI